MAELRKAAAVATRDYRRAETRLRAARYVASQAVHEARGPRDPGGLVVLAERVQRSRRRAHRANHRLRHWRHRLDAIVRSARSCLGIPYVWGGAGRWGFDCSGLTMYVMGKFGIRLWHGATAQEHALHNVRLAELQRGDLVFFGGPSYSHHVGLYVGGGRMIHAPHSGTVVSYGSINGAWTGGRP